MAERQSNIMGIAMTAAVMLLHNYRKQDVRMSIAQSERLNAAIRPIGGSIGAMTHISDNDTFSRPPTDSRGSSCDICGLLKGQG